MNELQSGGSWKSASKKPRLHTHRQMGKRETIDITADVAVAVTGSSPLYPAGSPVLVLGEKVAWCSVSLDTMVWQCGLVGALYQ